MKELRGRTAFVTGGASGFGYALAAAFASEGMNVMAADLDAKRLEVAVAELSKISATVSGVVCDVTDQSAVQRAAQTTINRFEKVHIVCNNAGILVPGPLQSVNAADWNWSFSVNLMGVLFGIEAFLPLLRAHGEGGQFVNTASMAGFRGLPIGAPYCASKAAVISVSESLLAELGEGDIGVTIVCPGFMRTQLYEHSLERPERYGGPKNALVDPSVADPTHLPNAILAGHEPGRVARRVVQAVKNNDLYVVTHPEHRSDVAAKYERIMRAYHDAALNVAAP
jgi:NAD(P)-dependent dehydrogenase (short-subunit alcohol dehydrogenase family)